MRGWLKSSFIVLLVFGTSWAGAVAYWRAANRMPSTADLLAYMVVLPLSLLLAAWVGRRLATLPAAAPAPTVAAELAPVAAQPQAPALAVLASALRTPHGAAPAELLDALRSGRARADLDPELVDDDGYPLLSLRADDALADAEAAYKDEIAAWLATGAMPDPQWNPEQWRALLLVTPVAAELALHAAAHPQAALPDSGAGSPMLQVRAALAGDWSEQQRAAAAGWLAHIAAQAGWPAGRIHAVAAQHSSAAVLAGLAGQGAAGETVLAIVLACGSRIGEDSVEALARQGALFGAARPQGRMPGEGAAGVLLADAVHAALFGTPAAMLQTTLAPHQDAAGKPDAGPLSRAAAPLLADGPTQAGALFADTGHRTARVMELMEFARAATPELDAGTEVLGAGRACGDCGDVPFLAALALAHHHATEAGDAALCVSNEDPLQRVAALIRPAALHS